MTPDVPDLQLVSVDGRRFWRDPMDGWMVPVVSGGSEDDGDQGDGKTDDGKTDDGKTDDGKTDDTVAFTPAQQAHIDKLIGKAKGTAKTAAEKELKAYLDQQSLGEADRLKAEKTQLEQEREDARAEVLATKIETSAERAALAAGVKPDRVDRFMRLVNLSDVDDLTIDGKPDTAAIRAAVDAALADVPEFKGTAAKTGSSGSDDMNGNGDKKTWTRAEIAAMSVADFEKNEAEINAALTGGRVN